MYVRRISATIAVLVVMFSVSGQGVRAVQEEPAQKHALEQATGPQDVLALETQGKLTVRALRAWNRLPPEFMDLAASLRREQGLDLLGAELETIQAWIEEAENTKPSIRPDLQNTGASWPISGSRKTSSGFWS